MPDKNDETMFYIIEEMYFKCLLSVSFRGI